MGKDITDLTTAYKLRMHFEFGDQPWSEGLDIQSDDRGSAITLAQKLVAFRMSCLPQSCELVKARLSDLAHASDAADIEPYDGAVMPAPGFYGPGFQQVFTESSTAAGDTVLTVGVGATKQSVTVTLVAGATTNGTIQTALRTLTFPNANLIKVTGSSGGPHTINLPGNIARVGGITGVGTPGTAGTAAVSPVTTPAVPDGAWWVNNIENALSLREEAALGMKNAYRWLHGVPDASIVGGEFTGVIVPTTLPPDTPQALDSNTQGNWEALVSDYLGVLKLNTKIFSAITRGAKGPQVTTYDLTKIKAMFSRSKKVGRRTTK